MPRLTVRKPALDFAETPKYWVLGDPQTTHELNILHFGIPAGERYFIDGVRLAMRYITDADLQADARSFVGQESVHARIHERAAAHLRLFDNTVVRQRVEQADRVRERLYRRIDGLPEPLRREATLVWLSWVMLGEHFTALFADMVFDETMVREGATDPDMAQLIKWHAAEELEHRSVPYDIFEHIGGRYVTRVAAAFPGFALVPAALIAITSAMMLMDPDIRRPFRVDHHIRAVHSRRAPSMLRVIAKLPPYLLPWYHPSQIGNDARARAWLASGPPSLSKRTA